MLDEAVKWIMLAVFIGVCFVAAAAGRLLSGQESDEWYHSLRKPPFTPPDWVFGPVWFALYVLMGVAAWLVWRARGLPEAAGPLALFGLQLLLNAAWPVLFFGLRRPGLAFAEILALWVAVAATTMAFFRASTLSGWLMLPYWAWVTFAVMLNGAIWRMNI